MKYSQKNRKRLKIWESIAHDWGCMTVENFDNKNYSFFAMEETFKKLIFEAKKYEIILM